MSPEGYSGKLDAPWFEFYASGVLCLSEMTWTNSVSDLTHKSIWRELPGRHVSDVPLLISFSLIADLKKLKKEKKNPVPLEIVPSHHQHTKHILCFGLIQLDVHWSFSCFQASLINFAVNGCLVVLFFPLACVCSWIISLSWWLFSLVYIEFGFKLLIISDFDHQDHN